MSNLSCGTHVAEPSANKDCRKLLNQFCRFLPKLKLPISADAKLPLTRTQEDDLQCLESCEQSTDGQDSNQRPFQWPRKTAGCM